jgi:hypothetical protein
LTKTLGLALAMTFGVVLEIEHRKHLVMGKAGVIAWIHENKMERW